jgi:membrane fusion protein, multidrug efflux system
VKRGPAVALLVILVLTVVTPARNSDAESSAPPSVLVQVTKLEKGSLPKTITVFGKIEASEAMRQDITAPATAVTEAVYVKPGQEVKAGTPLVRLGPTPEAAAAYKKAVAALNNARGLAERTKALLAQHLATRQQLADAQKAVSDAQDTINALAAEGASTPKTLSAPYDGVVMSVSASAGAIVNSGAALLTIARTNGLVLRAGAVPEQAEQIHDGDTAHVSTLGGGDTGTGTVLLRGSIVDPKTGLVPVEIGLPSGDFLAGQTAQAQIITGTVSGYLVPHEAVLVNEQGAPYVVQAKNMLAHQVPVTVLLSAGSTDVVTGALDPQAVLVLAGNYQLKDGMHVRLEDPKQPGSK